jgi:type I restriction enzyme S subunit
MTDASLPVGWSRATLKDLLLDIETGKSPQCEPRAANSSEYGVVKVSAMTYGQFRSGENKALPVGSSVDTSHEIRPGDLLVSRANTTAYVGAAVVVPSAVRPKLLLSDKSLRLVPHADVDRLWLRWALASPAVRKQIEGVASGTKDSMRNVSQAKFLALELAVPPANEQRRIAAELDVQIGLIDQVARELDLLGLRLKQAHRNVIQSGCRGELLPQRSQDGDAAAELEAALGDDPFSPSEGVPAVPAGWAWATLGSLAEVVGGVTKDSKRQHDPDFVEVPYLRVANVQEGSLRLDTVSTIRVSAIKAEQLRLRPGDVLLNEGGDRDKLGRGWIWEGEVPDCIHQNHVFRARVREDVLHPKLLSWHGNTFGRAWFEANGKQTTNLASISLTNVKRLPVAVPPRAEQDRIVEVIERHLELLTAAATGAIALRLRCGVLRRALLRAAFSGLLLPQDSGDEPAELLVKRIAEDRAADTSARMRKGRTETNARTTRRATEETQ